MFIDTETTIIQEFGYVKTIWVEDTKDPALLAAVKSARIWASSPRSVHVHGEAGTHAHVMARMLEAAADRAGVWTGLITTDVAAGTATFAW